jgi:hypothetical protein
VITNRLELMPLAWWMPEARAVETVSAVAVCDRETRGLMTTPAQGCERNSYVAKC